MSHPGPLAAGAGIGRMASVIPLRQTLRDWPLARAPVVSLRLARQRLVRPLPPVNGVLFLTYHDMRREEAGSFARQLHRLAEAGGFVTVDGALDHLAGGEGLRVCLTFDDGYRGAFEHAVPILARHSVPAMFFVVPGWIDGGRPGIMGWEECRQLRAAGMEIGSHSTSHRRLAGLPPGAVAAELAQSRARITDETGGPCRHFACPWGQPGADYHPTREPLLARQAGYSSFLTTVQRRAECQANPWALPRVRMEPGWGRLEIGYALTV